MFSKLVFGVNNEGNQVKIYLQCVFLVTFSAYIDSNTNTPMENRNFNIQLVFTGSTEDRNFVTISASF